MVYLKTIPKGLQLLSRGITWKKETRENKIYLTFDDGPNPESTPLLLKTLSDFEIKASFFCLGEQVEKYPHLLRKITSSGHMVGNHGYKHLDGWKSSRDDYIRNVRKAEKFIPSKLFRPPYGRIKKGQIDVLKEHFEIVLWDVMPGDFDLNVDAETLYQRMIRASKKGSVVVLHDQPSCVEKFKIILPRYVNHMKEKGFSFDILQSQKQ